MSLILAGNLFIPPTKQGLSIEKQMNKSMYIIDILLHSVFCKKIFFVCVGIGGENFQKKNFLPLENLLLSIFICWVG
jgi:hypothetical protein